MFHQPAIPRESCDQHHYSLQPIQQRCSCPPARNLRPDTTWTSDLTHHHDNTSTKNNQWNTHRYDPLDSLTAHNLYREGERWKIKRLLTAEQGESVAQ